MSVIINEAIVEVASGTAANFTSENPTLNEGEWGYETDTKFTKIGDGSTAWNSLDYQPNPAEVDGKAGLSTYSTGWVSNSDWTNVELAVNHALATDLSDLIVKFFISTDGTEANAFEIMQGWNRGFAVADYGFTFYQVDTNNIKIQTGTNGITHILDTGGASTIDTESWYYKIKVYKLS